jgi:hypothetical protein
LAVATEHSRQAIELAGWTEFHKVVTEAEYSAADTTPRD